MNYRKWVFAKPIEDGVLRRENLDLRDCTLPELQEGQALVRVKLINIHSGTRARMANGNTKLGETDPSNYGCAEVIQSRDPAFREGDVIACQAGWQDYQIVSSRDSSVTYGPPSAEVLALNRTNSQFCYVFRPELVKAWPPEVLMDMFGTSGLTAYFGMRECGPLVAEDAVAVGGATGSVGAIVAQLARIAGCRTVVGFGGGKERCEWVVDTLGITTCLDYRAADLEAQLDAAFPRGIDVFSDGIGGSFTELVTRRMNRDGRLFAFGLAETFYGGSKPSAPLERPSLRRAFGITDDIEVRLKERNIRSEAWIADKFYAERLQAENDLDQLMKSGALKPIVNVVEGFEQLPQAIVDLYETPRSGKLQVRFAS